MRRGLLQLSALLVFFALAVLPEAAIAQQLCTESDHGNSRFEIAGQTLTHFCGDRTKYQKVTYQFVAELSVDRLATMDSALQPGSLAAIKNYPSEKTLALYKLTLPTKNNFFLAVNRDSIPAEAVFGLWTDKIFHRRYTESGGPYNYDQSKSTHFNLVPTLVGLVQPARQYIELEDDKRTEGYLKYVGANSKWAIQDTDAPAGFGGTAGCAKSYDQYINDLKYFHARSIGREGYTVNKELKISLSGNRATITLPGSTETGDGLQRPTIVFTYRYYIAFRGAVPDVDYFYFLPPANSPHCNLVLRISNVTVAGSIATWPCRLLGLCRETAQGAILPINLRKIAAPAPTGQEDNRRIYELDQLGAFVLDYDPNVEENSVNQFIRKLYPGRNLHDPNTGTGKKNVKNEVDELGAIRVFSGDNPVASTKGENDCPITLPLIGPAMCAVADLVMGVAVSLAEFSFNLLMQATTLQ